MTSQLNHLRILPPTFVKSGLELFRAQTAATTQASPFSGLSPSPPSATTNNTTDKISWLQEQTQKIAVDGLAEVEAFKQNWLSEESQALWRRTQDEICPQGSALWRTDYIAAVKKRKVEEGKNSNHAAEGVISQPVDLQIPETDLSPPIEVVRAFQKEHPSTRIQIPSQAEQKFTCTITVAAMRFHILPDKSSTRTEYRVRYEDGAKSTTPLQDSILKHLNSRQTKGNLEFLLVIQASFFFASRTRLILFAEHDLLIWRRKETSVRQLFEITE